METQGPEGVGFLGKQLRPALLSFSLIELTASRPGPSPLCVYLLGP